jgi:glycosyltransferase involved in cell wall biosynthesis
MLKGVVVTMPTTLDYVEKFISNFSLSRPKIVYKYGGIIRQPRMNNIKIGPITGPLRVLFIGMKYTENGEDKGLDLFLSSCSLLIQSGIKLNISIVGNWSQLDLNGFLCESYCTIFGLVPNEELSNIYYMSDIAIFPTRYSKIARGNFDEFPVGSAIEAALHGIAIMTTNPLGMVTPLRPGIHYIHIDSTTKSICESFLDLDIDRERLLRLKVDGQKKFLNYFLYIRRCTLVLSYLKNF